MVPIQTLPPTPAHQRLRQFALAATVLVAIQTVLGLAMAFHVHGLGHVHELVGALTAIAAIACIFPARTWTQQTGDKGIFGHIAGVAVLAVLQLLLGFFLDGMPSAMLYVHEGLGILIAAGVVGVLMRARKDPAPIVTHTDRTV